MNDVKDFGDYSVKSVKSFMGHEGHGFNCNLYRNGKKIGTCCDDASGGGMYPVQWEQKGDWRHEQVLLKRHIKSLPKVDSDLGDEGLTIDEGWFVTELVTKWEKERDIRKYQRQCLTKTLFKTSDCKYGQHYVLNRAFCQKLSDNLKVKYGQDIEIFNEVFERGDIPSTLV